MQLDQIRPLFTGTDKFSFFLLYRERRFKELSESRAISMAAQVTKELNKAPRTKREPVPKLTADQLAGLKAMGLI
jgi:hypothetical protein